MQEIIVRIMITIFILVVLSLFISLEVNNNKVRKWCGIIFKAGSSLMFLLTIITVWVS